MNATDAVLLERWAAERDAEAFREIVSRHAGMVFGTCLRILGNREDAEDVSQKCFIKLAQGVRPSRTSLTGLLHTMARHEAYNVLRSSSRRREREHVYSDARGDRVEFTFDDIAEHVDDAIAELPEKERCVVVAHFLEGRTHEAIAEEFGVGRSTVSYRVGKGVERIRAKLAAKGITASATGLGAVLASARVEAAPAGLVAAVGKLAVAGTAGTVTGVAAVATGGVFAIWKVAAAVSLVAVAAGGGFLIAQTPTEDAVVNAQAGASDDAPEPENPAADPPDNQRVATAAASVSDDSMSPSAIRGIVVNPLGFPRPDVYLSNDWPWYVTRGERADDDGRFTIPLPPVESGSWMAYSQNTASAALFTLPSEPPADEMQVVLDMGLMNVEGRVVGRDQEGVANAQVEIRLVSPDGSGHVAAPLTTDKEGFFIGGRFPTAEGWSVEARVLPPAPEEPAAWQSRADLLHDSFAVVLRDLEVSDDTAANIAENGHGNSQTARRDNAGPRHLYGGCVKDPNGNPIEGVQIELMYDTKNHMVSSGMTRSDAEGRWQTMLPAELMQVSVRAQHAEYIPTVEDPEFQNPPLARLMDGTSEFVMRPGAVVEGTVRNEAGEPVGDVLVLGGDLYSTTPGGWKLTSSAPMEDLTSARTDREGRFRLANVGPNDARLQFLSYDYAPQVKKLIPRELNGPIDVVLDEGGTIRGRITDVDGAPIPGAYISGNRWQMDEQFPLNVRALADEEGWFALGHVPNEGTSSFRFGVRGENGRRDRKYLGMTAESLTPRDEPYMITMYEPITFNGRVVDADTGEPITRFTVRNGWQWAGQDRVSYIDMSSPSRIRSDDGTFEKRLDGVGISHPPTTAFAVGIFPDDYIPANSPLVYLGEPNEPFEIRLKRGAPFKGRVVDGHGEPVRGAQVVWIGPGETAHVQNGQHDDRYINSPANADRTLASGKFELPPSDQPGLILALDQAGYAVIASSNFQNGADVRLFSWATVKGVLHSDSSDPVRVQMRPLGEWDLDAEPPIRWNFWDASHTDGRFEFEHVPAVPFEVGRLTVAARTAELSHGAYLTPHEGESHHLIVGGGGVSVTGSVVIPDGLAFDPQHLRIAARSLATDGEIQPRYVPKVDDNGAFSLVGVPAGRYAMEAFYHAPPMPMVCGSGMLLAQGATEFVVPERGDGPFSAGAVALKVVERPEVGVKAPDLAGWTFDDEEFSLAQWDGKFVVLDFWASWCPPCRAETPRLAELRERFSSSSGVEFVGLNFDHNAEAGKAFAKSVGLDWPQLSIGDWNADNVVLKEFGVSAIPSLWLIGVDGEVLGRDLTFEGLRELLADVVPE